jgi:hypothetical protein
MNSFFIFFFIGYKVFNFNLQCFISHLLMKFSKTNSNYLVNRGVLTLLPFIFLSSKVGFLIR